MIDDLEKGEGRSCREKEEIIQVSKPRERKSNSK
jgi:hypothetical protein